MSADQSSDMTSVLLISVVSAYGLNHTAEQRVDWSPVRQLTPKEPTDEVQHVSVDVPLSKARLRACTFDVVPLNR